jgi:signal transduction histidine kinase/DNA-binding response OmpR family regulator
MRPTPSRDDDPPLLGSAGSTFQRGLLSLSVVLILAAAIYSVVTVSGVRGSADWVSHTQNVEIELQELLASIYNVETDGLRYLLSEREDYLREHTLGIEAVELQLGRLGEMLADNPAQIDRLVELRGLLRGRNEFYRAAVGERQTQGVTASVERVRAGRGHELLVRVQALIAEMNREEARLLRERQAELDAVMVQSTVTVLLVNVLALVLGSVALFSLRRGARARAAEELAKVRAQEAERASREKSQFLANMSHEIRTPMNAVFGFSQLLARTRIEPQAKEYIRAIQTSGRALLALINDILDLSKIEAGKLDLHPQRSDLRELIDSTLTVFGESAKAKGLAMRARISPALPASLWLDPHRVRQVLNNLVSNAVKYTERGQITISAEARPRAPGSCDVVIEVRDTGPGIAHELQERVFQPFQRGVAGAETPQGTGLGLAIVGRLLALMDGRIELDSAPGRGSCFRVLLQGVAVSALSPSSDGERGDEVDFARLAPSRILVVDDVPWNRELLAAFLSEGGHSLAFAGHGEEALSVAESFDPELVLMDLRMPVMDGREATRRLREWDAARRATSPLRPPLRIVAVSASSMAAEERAVRGEFEAYVRKPVSREALFEALARLLPAHAEAAMDAPGAAQQMSASAAGESRLSKAERDPQRHADACERLRQLQQSQLPGLLQSLRVSEVRALAEELADLADAVGSETLAAYAQRLGSAVERFDVVLMESLLHQFDAHVEDALRDPASDC